MVFPPHLWIQANSLPVAEGLAQRVGHCPWSWLPLEQPPPVAASGLCLRDCRRQSLAMQPLQSVPTMWLISERQVADAEWALAQAYMTDYVRLRNWNTAHLKHHWARLQGQQRTGLQLPDSRLFQGLQDLVFVLDQNLCYQQIYGVWQQRLPQMGYSLLGKRLDQVTSADQAALHLFYQRQALEGQEVQYYWENADLGLYFCLDLRPWRDASGAIQGVLGVGRDISELKQTELKLQHILEDKEVLLQETYHRVKNNLQVISSMLNLQARQAADSATLSVLRETQNRILAMALIHEQLYESGALAQIPFASYIRDLATQLLQAYPQPGAHITFGCDSLSLSIDPALLGGLILNELVSNCLRHAFAPETADGEVHISLRAVAGSPDYVLAVRDNGRGFPPDLDISYPRTVGLRLVRRLAQQLGGNLEVRTGTGTEVRVRFKPY